MNNKIIYVNFKSKKRMNKLSFVNVFIRSQINRIRNFFTVNTQEYEENIIYLIKKTN